MSNTSEDPDVWIAQLMNCKPLSEGEVKKLCDKVSSIVSIKEYQVSFPGLRRDIGTVLGEGVGRKEEGMRLAVRKGMHSWHITRTIEWQDGHQSSSRQFCWRDAPQLPAE